jgi:hypothetical protein
MRSRLAVGCFLVALFGLFSATRAKADDVFTYQLGSNTYVWQLPTSPTVGTNDGSGFYVPIVPFSLNGVAQPPELFDFWASSAGGGFSVFGGTFPYTLDEYGAQLYGGTESDPTFSPGTFYLTDGGVDGPTGTLVITSSGSSTVPEPGSLLLTVAGLLALISLAWKDLRLARK